MPKGTNKKQNGCYAAIDIGSNAVRLLIKQLDKGIDSLHFNKVLLVRVPLRLGFDVFSDGKISERKEKNMVRLMKSYNYLMKIYDVNAYRACATSAMRDAKNGKDIIRNIKQKTGIEIEIIDGKEEAQMVYNNHFEYMADRKGNYIYVDVGGGSTEINLLSEGKLVYSQSYNIGTVRILNGATKEEEWERLKYDLKKLAKDYPDTDIIGSGGNINKLYRLIDKKDKKLQRMSVSSLQELHSQLKTLSIEQRMEQFSLKSDRADVIVPAGDIFITIAEILDSKYIYVPTIGLADGIIDALYNSQKSNLN